MIDRRRFRMAAALFGAWLIVLLAACGAADSGAPASERFIFGLPPTLIAEDAPPCQFADWTPYHNIQALCAETVYDDVTPPEAAPALASITFADDGTLYMVRTAFGNIWALRDADGDQFMEEPYRVAAGLTLPTGIAAFEGALYVVAMDGVLRLDDPDGDGVFDASTVLVSDLPGAEGAWSGSVGIGPDKRLYVSVRAATSSTGPDGPATSPAALAGLLVSYALDGSDEQIVATGFRDPADFAWHPATGDLWIVDSGGGAPDELNRVEPGGDYATRQPEFTFPFPAESHPAGIAFYASEAIPFWTGDLVVAQRGSWNLPEPAGYAVLVVPFDDTHAPTLPLDRVAPRDAYGHAYDEVAIMSLRGLGFFPYHPVDVAVSAEGWIYVALQEGRILRFRPRPKANEAVPLYVPSHPTD